MKEKNTYSRNDFVERAVQIALADDVGSGDVSAALISVEKIACAHVVTREKMVLCGVDWLEAVFLSLDSKATFEWFYAEGDSVEAGALIVKIQATILALLTGERCALNFLQILSGTATCTRAYVDQVKGMQVTILDTRKTVPGLRYAQKYAVRCGGGTNHRMGLFESFLLKENHIKACGSIDNAVSNARRLYPDYFLEVEVETMSELKQALLCKVDRILLDNFSIENLKKAVSITEKKVPLEVSGAVTLQNLTAIAKTGIDFISVGAITKNVRSIDLSMRL